MFVCDGELVERRLSPSMDCLPFVVLELHFRAA